MAEITSTVQLEAWLKDRPRQDAVLIAARCALRVVPLSAPLSEKFQSEVLKAMVQPMLRGIVLTNIAGSWPSQSDIFVDIADSVSDQIDTAADLAINEDPGIESVIRSVADACTSVAADQELPGITSDAAMEASYAANSAAGKLARTTFWKAVDDDVYALAHGSVPEDFNKIPLWHAGTPRWIRDPWYNLRAHLLAADEGWEVWTDWYQDRLDGNPAIEELEVAKALIPDEIWEAGPATLNAEIARLIAEHAAERPAGEGIDFDPVSEKVVSLPAPVERENAVETAVSLVEDSLLDLRASAVGNRCYALNHVFVRLDRMLTKYRDNPLRLHEDMKFAAEEIVTEMDKDGDLDEGPVRALRDACGQGVIDIRISVPDVGEMAADRQRRIARKPSANARRAVDRLMNEIGEGIDPDLREQMADDLKSVELSAAGDGEEMADGAARDAFLTSVHRFAWLYRFSRLGEGRIAAMAQRLDTSVESIDRAITLFRGAEGWWGVIEWLMKVI